MPFLYPPISIYILKFFTLFAYKDAYFVFLALKVILFSSTIAIWLKYFTNNLSEKILLLIITMVSFHEAVSRDFLAGNISSFEQFFIWIALLGLLKERTRQFAIFFVLGCLFKPINLLLFLPLSFLMNKKDKIQSILWIASLLAFIHGLAFIIDPKLTIDFFHHANLVDERGSINPCSFALISDKLMVYGFNPPNQINYLNYLVYGAFAGIVAIVSFFHFRKIDKHLGIMLACVVFAIIAPRFKDYSYILLALPAAIMLVRLKANLIFKIIAFIIIITHFIPYQSLYGAISLLILFLIDYWKREKFTELRIIHDND